MNNAPYTYKKLMSIYLLFLTAEKLVAVQAFFRMAIKRDDVFVKLRGIEEKSKENKGYLAWEGITSFSSLLRSFNIGIKRDFYLGNLHCRSIALVVPCIIFGDGSILVPESSFRKLHKTDFFEEEKPEEILQKFTGKTIES